MNEQDNIGIIRKLYAAFAVGDVQTIMDHVADDAGWVEYGSPMVPYMGARSGKAEILEFFQAMAGSTRGGSILAEHFLADGDMVVMVGRFRATVQSTGSKIDAPIVHVFTMSGGKIARWEGFSDTEQVVAAHTGKTASTR